MEIKIENDLIPSGSEVSSFARNSSSHKNIRRDRQMAPIATTPRRKSAYNTRQTIKKCSAFAALFQPHLDDPCSRELDKRMSHSSFCRGMSRTGNEPFNAENEYTCRCTCSPGGGCRLGSVQLGVLISGYFIPPPFRFAPSPSHRPSALPVLIPESASLPRPLRPPSLSRRRVCLFLPRVCSKVHHRATDRPIRTRGIHS